MFKARSGALIRSREAKFDTEIGSIAATVAPGTDISATESIAIRPEYVEVMAGGKDVTASTNSFRGEIVNVSFYGDSTDYQIRIAGGLLVTARVSPMGTLAAGTQVFVKFPPERLIPLGS
jgi:hypothetical protein